jgi:hypothetical protein
VTAVLNTLIQSENWETDYLNWCCAFSPVHTSLWSNLEFWFCLPLGWPQALQFPSMQLKLLSITFVISVINVHSKWVCLQVRPWHLQVNNKTWPFEVALRNCEQSSIMIVPKVWCTRVMQDKNWMWIQFCWLRLAKPTSPFYPIIWYMPMTQFDWFCFHSMLSVFIICFYHSVRLWLSSQWI